MQKRQLSPLQVTGNLCVSNLTIQSLARVQQGETLNELAQQVAILSEEDYADLQEDLAATAQRNHTKVEEVLKKYLKQST